MDGTLIHPEVTSGQESGKLRFLIVANSNHITKGQSLQVQGKDSDVRQ